MNRLVIIGNGFDLAHGLKTSYNDFIRWYLDSFIKHFFENELLEYKDELLFFRRERKYDSNTGMLEIGAKDYRAYVEKPNEPWNLLKVIHQKYGFIENEQILLNRILKKLTSKGWNGIESDYYALLKENADNIEVCKSLNIQMDFLRDKLAEYLKTLTFKNRIGSIGLIFNSGIKEEDVAISSMKRFDKEVSSYERNIFRPCGDGMVDRTMVLDFNYTDTVLNYVPLSCENHIHGCLDNPNSMIFGYGDEMDKEFELLESRNENELLKNSKSIKYIEADNYRNLLNFIKSDIFQVFIMGHSCGNSDRTLLHTIFEHENCISIKPFYYKWGEKEGEDDYSEITRNIYRNFKDKTLFRDRVVNKKQCEPMPQVEKKEDENRN